MNYASIIKKKRQKYVVKHFLWIDIKEVSDKHGG